MQSHSRVAELLVQTGAFRDLENPVVLASGELGIYYVYTENLLQDGGRFNDFGDNAREMIEHAMKMAGQNPAFGEVVDILAEKVSDLFSDDPEACFRAVSGGQRRDWLFSGPVAHRLDLTHIAIYKDGSIVPADPDGNEITRPMAGFRVVHVADLITEGSSVYRVENGEMNGWVPSLRRGGMLIQNLVAVVTRLQGGEARLAQQEVNVSPLVAIDEAFLRAYSAYPDRAVAYLQNPAAWSENYLRRNGALELVTTFDPQGGKLDRAARFLQRYQVILTESGQFAALAVLVEKRYMKSLAELVGGATR